MLIPSIDLKDGQVVQLVQGKRLALASDDVFAWVRKFARYPKVQLIDLDGALESGANDFLVRRICKHLPCRVGGGIRTIARAEDVLGAGATHVIVSSSLFRHGQLDLDFAKQLSDAVGVDRVIAAVFGPEYDIPDFTDDLVIGTAHFRANDLIRPQSWRKVVNSYKRFSALLISTASGAASDRRCV